LIQYAAEEAAAAGITDLIFIIGRSKRSIADHFDKALRGLPASAAHPLPGAAHEHA
jgi:UTP-glucose-1-phosphate uridylyltransferase